MQYRRVGRSGLKVSAISIGGWLTFGASVEQSSTNEILAMAIDHGINFIDLADVYGKGQAEHAAGAAIADMRRTSLVLSSKVFWPMGEGPNDRGLSRKHIIESCEASLRRLGTDYLDLYFCHREDEETPLEETVRAMDTLVQQGKILYWGTSCWGAGTLVKTQTLCTLRGYHGPIVEQPPYNVLRRSIEGRVMPVAHRLGMGLVVWSPLAGGALTGKYDEGIPEGSRGAESSWLDSYLTPERRPKLRRFSSLAREMGCTPAQLALAFCLRRPEISCVITGASAPEQLQSNIDALEVTLDSEVLAELDKLFPK